MTGGRMCVMVGGMVFLSGCATTQTAQELDRLRSQVGLLDQRISQLERESLRGAAGTMPIEPSAGAASTRPAPTPSTSSVTFVKPSTKEVQQALKNAGFYQGALDGKMGPVTREAVRQFQQTHGLKVDGVVGKQTWNALSPYATLSSPDEVSAAEPLK